RYDVADLVHEHVRAVGERKRRAEGARDLVERIDLAVRVLDLIEIGGRRERAAVARATQRACAGRMLVKLNYGEMLIQPMRRDFKLKLRQMFEEQFNDLRIEARAGVVAQERARFVARLAGSKRPAFAHRVVA